MNEVCFCCEAEPVYFMPGGFTRGMCERCDAERHDLPDGDWSH